MSQDANWLEKIADGYQGNPVLRALIQIPRALVPFGLASALDVAVTSTLEKWRRQRHRAFYDELAKGEHLLTADLIKREDFVHDYLCTLRAAVNTRRQDKIRLFARLLLGAVQAGEIGSDRFEEFLGILDDLSVRELSILLILRGFLADNPAQTLVGQDGKSTLENDLQRLNRFWPDFEREVQRQLQVEPGELRAMLNRLNRTGLYESLIGYFDYQGGRGLLTPLFIEFTDWLQINQENLASDQSVASSHGDWVDRVDEVDTDGHGDKERGRGGDEG